MKVLTIGDLHCRKFWKDAVKDWNGPIVFLGDYVDPYPYEWDEDEQMPNPVDYLLEVINFKDCNPDRVTLLLGNHKLFKFLVFFLVIIKNNLEEKILKLFTIYFIKTPLFIYQEKKRKI